MAAFKLPRLKSNLAIVNGQGRPTDFFLRLFNIDMAQRLETVINDQQAIIDAIVAAKNAADAAQQAAEAAQNTADAAVTGSATDSRVFSGIISSSSFVTLGEVEYPNRVADGWWNAQISASASADGIGTNAIEVILIEDGQPTPLATATATGIDGSTPSVLTLDFSPAPPYKQTAPAGNITLLLQARRVSGTSNISVSGTMTTSYMPSPS